MQGYAIETRPAHGAENHAQAAWQRLQTPGTPAEGRAEAIEAFAEACRAIEDRGPAAIHAIARTVESKDPGMSARATAAARILAEVGTWEAAAALIRIALSDDITVAGRALGALPSMRVSQAAQALLVDAVRTPAPFVEEQRRSLLAEGLGRQLVAGADFEATAWAAEHPLENVRCAWTRALARVGGPAALAHLPARLDDADATVRAWAAFGLVLEGDLDKLPLLVQCARGRSAGERAAAVGLLGVLPVPEAVTPVLAATTDRSPLVARAAIVRAGQLGVRASLLAISDQLENRRADIVEQAAWSLRDLLGEDPGFAWMGRRLTAASVAAVRGRCRAAHEAWPPRLRHALGRLITPDAAAKALDGAGSQAAYFTLLGMCGCSFGYDPGADAVANREPIRKLRRWATDERRSLTPGAFYLKGKVVGR
jgi:HEAT repeat protein